MTPERVHDLIEAYGADPDNFPEHERATARALMQARPQHFDAALDDAARLDRLLDALDVPMPSKALLDKLVSGAPQASAGPRFSWRFPAFVPAGAFAALAIGFGAGVLVAPASAEQDPAALLQDFGFTDSVSGDFSL